MDLLVGGSLARIEPSGEPSPGRVAWIWRGIGPPAAPVPAALRGQPFRVRAAPGGAETKHEASIRSPSSLGRGEPLGGLFFKASLRFCRKPKTPENSILLRDSTTGGSRPTGCSETDSFRVHLNLKPQPAGSWRLVLREWGRGVWKGMFGPKRPQSFVQPEHIIYIYIYISF